MTTATIEPVTGPAAEPAGPSVTPDGTPELHWRHTVKGDRLYLDWRVELHGAESVTAFAERAEARAWQAVHAAAEAAEASAEVRAWRESQRRLAELAAAVEARRADVDRLRGLAGELFVGGRVADADAAEAKIDEARRELDRHGRRRKLLEEQEQKLRGPAERKLRQAREAAVTAALREAYAAAERAKAELLAVAAGPLGQLAAARQALGQLQRMARDMDRR